MNINAERDEGGISVPAGHAMLNPSRAGQFFATEPVRVKPGPSFEGCCHRSALAAHDDGGRLAVSSWLRLLGNLPQRGGCDVGRGKEAAGKADRHSSKGGHPTIQGVQDRHAHSGPLAAVKGSECVATSSSSHAAQKHLKPSPCLPISTTTCLIFSCPQRPRPKSSGGTGALKPADGCVPGRSFDSPRRSTLG